MSRLMTDFPECIRLEVHRTFRVERVQKGEYDGTEDKGILVLPERLEVRRSARRGDGQT